MENVLPAKFEEAREEEKLRSQREDFNDMVTEVCSVGLWWLDGYREYCLFTLFGLFVFEYFAVKLRLALLSDLLRVRVDSNMLMAYRCGMWIKVAGKDLIPGDVVSIGCAAGHNGVVPTDILILAGTAIVNEAILTGDSIPQWKMLEDARCFPSCNRSLLGEPTCTPQSSQYKGTLDVFQKIIRQEGLARFWRGTTASLALAVPTVGIYMPCYDIFRNYMDEYSSRNAPTMTPYVPLVAGSIARSLTCIFCYPVELARTRMQAYKDQHGTKPPGVWKTLVGVVYADTSTKKHQIQVQE